MRYGLLGYRISYTLSPIIHNTLYKLLNINAVYEVIDVEPERLTGVVDYLRNINGFNITIPHKVSFIKYLDLTDETVEITGSVNTVKVVNGKFIGYNTDVSGIVNSLISLKISKLSEDNTALILGAGGAARAAIYALYIMGVRNFVVVNRSRERALETITYLSRSLSNVNFKYVVWDLRNDVASKSDIIVNCTPVGTCSNESPLDKPSLSSNHLVIDLVYRPRITKLLSYAIQVGARIVDGLRILIYQALEAEKIWLNIDVVQREYFEKIEKTLISHDLEC